MGSAPGESGGVARLQRSNSQLGVTGAVLRALIDVGAAYDDVLVVHDHHLAVHLSAHSHLFTICLLAHSSPSCCVQRHQVTETP